MFYHWLAPLGKTYIIFNLFNYISFRAAGATVTALLLAFLVGPPVIGRLRARKVGQVIRADGPSSHQSKRGTPTMGGLIIILATVVPTLLWAPLTNRFVVVAMISILWMGCIGFLIERQLGRGGMTTVYLAHDLKHGGGDPPNLPLPSVICARPGFAGSQECYAAGP